jgi:LEA14-like dessication related protein
MMLRYDRFFQTTSILLPLAAVVTLLISLTACGCGVRQLSKGELQPPEVRFKGVMMQPPTNQGWPLTLVLAVENPNSMTIKVLGYDYEVWVAGQSVAKGVGNQPVILPAQGETTVTVPVLLKLRTLPGLLPNLLQEKKIPVEIAGGLRLPQTLGFRVPFRFREEVTPQEGLEHLKPFLGR